MAVDERDDERLLDTLAVALRPQAAEPSMAELAALDRIVAGAGSGRGSSVPRRLVAAAAVLAVVGTGGTAYANSPSSPREVRSVAHAMKLPGVEAPDLTDARKALDDLEEELAERRPAQVQAAVDDVLEELEELTVAQRAGLEPRLTALFDRASALVAVAPADAEDLDEAEAADDGDEFDGDVDEPEEEPEDGSSGSGRGGSDDGDGDSSGQGRGRGRGGDG